MISLHDLKPDDLVALWANGRFRPATVERITKTQIIVYDIRFNRKTGHEIGGSRLIRSRIEPWTDQHDTMEERV